MKKIAILFTVIFLFVNSSLSAQQRTASITFTEESFDFGKIKEADGLVTHKFSFTNTGTVPLLIQNAQPSCGCTTPDWTKQPVMPGAKGFVKATFDPNGRPGTFDKSITVFSNADRPTVTLKISGSVAPKPLAVMDEYRFPMGDLKLNTSFISFGKVGPLSKMDTIIRFINAGKEPLNIKLLNIPVSLKASFKPEVIKPSQKGEIYIVYDASKKNDWGFLFDYVTFTLNGKQDPAYKITVAAEITEDFSKLTPKQLENAPKIKFENTNFNFGTIKEGQKSTYDFNFKNEGKSELILRKVVPSCGCTTTTPKDMKVKPGGSSTIHVVFDSSGKKGSQSKTITIITNDPQTSNLMLWIKGTVE